MDIFLGLALSTHIGLARDYNEVHPHLRIQSGSYVAGAYHNSINNLSVYGAKRWEGVNGGFFELGAVTGYDYSLVPFVRAGKEIDNFSFFVTPAYEEGRVGVVFAVEMIFQVR